MKLPSTMNEIHAAIQATLPHAKIKVIDLSHQHKGHLDYDSGHFEVQISDVGLLQLPLIQRHQIIYQAVNMSHNVKIHALKITFIS